MALFGIFGKPNIDKLKAKGNVRGLIKALGYTKNWLVREKAAEALGKIRDPRAVEPLSNALKDTCREYRGGGEEDAGVGTWYWTVRDMAAEALVKIDSPAVEPLINALKGKDSDVRGWAATALRKMGVSF